ncbi:hypothetical protein EDB92DRAFT_1890417 [Lactarius akahatsu]|uniref:Uncharacterized protein n=1 Tax=Lactarius akahatsu TaxID=416441 RepID=A0AAD4Q9P5_9AGAM|nr:hypothetical protein EDB92DRAFT_1890417 [Lactarius akahatsu]
MHRASYAAWSTSARPARPTITYRVYSRLIRPRHPICMADIRVAVSHVRFCPGYMAFTRRAYGFHSISFSARSDHLLDPETPLRNPETINYPSKEDPSVIPVHGLS